MRKARAEKDTAVKTFEVPVGMLGALSSITLAPLLRVRDEIQRADNYVTDYTNDIARFEREIEGRKRNIEQVKEAKEQNIIEEKKLAKVEPLKTEEINEKAAHAVRALAKHVGVVNVTDYDKNGTIKVETPLLFTDIREESGSKKTVRACIGAFDVYINVRAGHQRIKVTNRIFTPLDRGYGHWAIKNDAPCLGEWQNEITPALARGDYYGAFDLMYHYLREADNDSAAYHRSHTWRDTYRRAHTGTPIAYDIGTYVIAVQEYDGNRSIIGRVGKIIGCETTGSVCVRFRMNVDGGNNSHSCDDGDCEFSDEDEDGENCLLREGSGTNTWYIPASDAYLIVIPIELYNRRKSYTLAPSKVRDAVKILDKMKDGTTYDDAMAKLNDGTDKTVTILAELEKQEKEL